MLNKLYSLSFITTKDYEANLQTLIKLINDADNNSLIVAPEVCLTGYDYDNFEEMHKFSKIAIDAIKKVSKNKIIILTMLEKKDDKVYNFAKVFYNEEVIKNQAKANLFKFGQEHHYIEAGDVEDINIIKIDGIKIGLLICFELRFKDLWQKLEGADIIAIPSWWGVLRQENFKTLTQALAVMNQCFVVATDSLNEECTGQSGIITPFGDVTREQNKNLINIAYNKKEIIKMRRYMDVGIKSDD